MKATNMMHKMMVAASLLAVSACGSVSSPGGNDDGSGSDDANTTCEVASDCAGGAACDTVAHECVTDVLAIESTDFVNDGLRWWSATSGPKLWGTYEGALTRWCRSKSAPAQRCSRP